MKSPEFTHEELKTLASAIAQYCDAREEPCRAAETAREKLDAYLASSTEARGQKIAALRAKLVGLKNEAKIVRSVEHGLKNKVWRSEAEKEAIGWLAREERSRKEDVSAYVCAMFDAAGAGYSGRWQ